jgi:hypothetical protein
LGLLLFLISSFKKYFSFKIKISSLNERLNEKIKENEVLTAKFSEKLKIGKFFVFKFLK